MTTTLVALGTALAVLGGLYMAMTLVLARARYAVPEAAPDGLRWVLVVAALNEELVIGPTVTSLVALGDEVMIVVVDDGSDDATAEVATSVSDRVVVLRRQVPEARQGKGAALNAAYAHVVEVARREGWDPARVVVGVVDGDGRLGPDAVSRVGRYFADPGVGAVQVQVRISNRSMGWLARIQDYEFLTFSSLTQMAREHLGSVGLGGNGQFTRLSALMEVDEGGGPWGGCLTEDLDLGIRLVLAGWENRFTTDVEVRQQGLTSVRRVVRQRTRWMQGHLQCWRHLRALWASSLPTRTVLDMSWYLLGPALFVVLSVAFGVVVAVTAVAVAAYAVLGHGLMVTWWALVPYGLAFGPGLLFAFAYRKRAGDIGVVGTVLLAHVLWAYNYLWYLATWRALGRIVLRRSGWVKTARLVEAADAPAG